MAFGSSGGALVTPTGPGGAATSEWMTKQGYVQNPITGGWYSPGSGYVGAAGSQTFGDPSNFASADTRQTSDYDSIMQSLKDTMSSLSAPVYNTPAPVSGSLDALRDLTSSGGFGSGDIANLRERAISPVRSIYANAQSNIERQKNLQGGYSPNYTAASAKLTRDESQQVDDAVIGANASIAQNIAQNKIAAASPYASAASAEAGRQLQSSEFVPEIKSRLLGSMTSLYGTTPALTNMFGNQVAEAARLGQGQQELNMRNQQLSQNMLSPILQSMRYAG